MYLHYEYFPNLNDEKKYLKDDYFAFKNMNKTTSTKIFCKFINQESFVRNQIINYVNKFADKII